MALHLSEAFSAVVAMLSQVCDDIIILHLSYLAYPHYVITVHIYGLHSVVLDAIVFKVCAASFVVHVHTILCLFHARGFCVVSYITVCCLRSRWNVLESSLPHS